MLKINLVILLSFLACVRTGRVEASPVSSFAIDPQDKPILVLGYSDSDEEGDDAIHYYESNILFSLDVRASGDIELTRDDRNFQTLPEGGYVSIKERNWFTYRELEVRQGAKGPEISFFVQGRPYDFDEEAAHWLANRLPEIASRTGLGARHRIERILQQDGVASAIREISLARSNRARQTYARIIIAQSDIDTRMKERLIRVVAEEMSSSSRLSETLIQLAEKEPQDSVITSTLIMAVDRISSSSKQKATLLAIAEKRRLDKGSAVAMARVIEAISSSSAQADALLTLLKYSTPDEEVEKSYLEAVESMSSSSSQEVALLAMIDRKPRSTGVWMKILEVIQDVSSTSVQGDALRAFASKCPMDDTILLSFVSTVGFVSSSSKQGDVLMALLEREGLSQRVLEDIIRFSESEISSSSVSRRISDRVTKILLAGKKN